MQPAPLHKAAHVVELTCLLRLSAFLPVQGQNAQPWPPRVRA